MGTTWRIAGINFDHMHMGDLLRMVHNHPNAEIVGICHEDRARMEQAIGDFAIPDAQVFTDYRACLERTRPDLVVLCPATAHHADWTEKVAAYDVHIVMEKPFAASLAEADRMIAAQARTGKMLAINWPLRWVAAHVTAKRLVDEGVIGTLREVRYYGGNRGPLHHVADKVETTPEYVAREKSKSWFYQKAAGGGSLQDYLGYGTTLGTWFLNGATPIEVTCTVDAPQGLQVDEHSVTVARYEAGLSTFETRWGTFTDPWVHQPQPKCGFVLEGSDGTIGSYDYEPTIRLQTGERPQGDNVPVDRLDPPYQNPIQYVLHCLEQGRAVEGPLSPKLCRIGQQIIDTAAKSAEEKRTLPLFP
jgi:predicted dehydrogenase